MRFVPGKSGRGVLISREESILTYPIVDRMDAIRGAVAFWFRPNWGADDAEHHTLLASIDGRWHLLRTRHGNLAFNYADGPWQPENVFKLHTSVKSWNAGEWHHIRLEWDMDGESRLIVDGDLAATKWSVLGKIEGSGVMMYCGF